jgi:hypothetical protein
MTDSPDVALNSIVFPVELEGPATLRMASGVNSSSVFGEIICIFRRPLPLERETFCSSTLFLEMVCRLVRKGGMMLPMIADYFHRCERFKMARRDQIGVNSV